MATILGQRGLRICAWFCVILLAYLSLIPGDFQVRTGASALLEHFVAYFGTTTLFMLAYPAKRILSTVFLVIYACLLETCQLFSPGRFASVVDAGTSVSGVVASSALSAVILNWVLTRWVGVPAKGPRRADRFSGQAE